MPTRDPLQNKRTTQTESGVLEKKNFQAKGWGKTARVAILTSAK